MNDPVLTLSIDQVLEVQEAQTIIIDYSLILEQMVAAGRYDWKHDDITAEHFPITGNGVITLETKLFHFNRLIQSEEATKLIVSADLNNSWQVAKIEHELAYGTAYPEEQRKFPIIALGSSCELGGARFVPCLGRYGTQRDLYLDNWCDYWEADGRFLAFRLLAGCSSTD